MFAALGGVLGAIIGSFLATLVIRWPERKSVLVGRSTCDHCSTPLRPIDLVPLLSFIALRGKCSRCSSTINRDHIIIEAMSAIVGAVALGLAPHADGLAGAVFGWILIGLAMLDLRHFWLPDQLTGLLALGGIAAGFAGIHPLLTYRLWGGLAGFLSLFLIATLYRLIRKREGLGGGDPKLLGAIGLWLGWQVLPGVVLGASLIGLGLAGVGLARGHKFGSSTRLPLGSLLALSAMCAWIIQHIPQQ